FAEDEYLQALIDRDNKISFFKEQLDNTKEQLDNTKEQLDNTKEQLDNTKEQLDNTKEQLDNTKEQLDIEIELRKKKDKALNEKDNVIFDFAKTLKNSGLPNIEIQQKTGLSIEIIEKL
ncbi:MAG: hypothetical protein NT004_19765, partial [Bacteroidetes bacterium]|nr:hypothetical protein [Bacteroidota bacterium]